jgi:hypothetical protein
MLATWGWTHIDRRARKRVRLDGRVSIAQQRPWGVSCADVAAHLCPVRSLQLWARYLIVMASVRIAIDFTPPERLRSMASIAAA